MNKKRNKAKREVGANFVLSLPSFHLAIFCPQKIKIPNTNTHADSDLELGAQAVNPTLSPSF